MVCRVACWALLQSAKKRKVNNMKTMGAFTLWVDEEAYRADLEITDEKQVSPVTGMETRIKILHAEKVLTGETLDIPVRDFERAEFEQYKKEHPLEAALLRQYTSLIIKQTLGKILAAGREDLAEQFVSDLRKMGGNKDGNH